MKHKKINHLNVRDIKITEPQDISNAVNKFFSEIGENLATNFANQDNDEYKKYLGPPAPQSIFLHKITETEILDTIKTLKKSNSSGHDDITSKFVKISAPILTPALVEIFNLALSTGIYPSSLKID